MNGDSKDGGCGSLKTQARWIELRLTGHFPLSPTRYSYSWHAGGKNLLGDFSAVYFIRTTVVVCDSPLGHGLTPPLENWLPLELILNYKEFVSIKPMFLRCHIENVYIHTHTICTYKRCRSDKCGLIQRIHTKLSSAACSKIRSAYIWCCFD